MEGSKRKKAPQKSKVKTIGFVFLVMLVIGMIGNACGSDHAENLQPEPTAVAVSEAAAVRSMPLPEEAPVPEEKPAPEETPSAEEGIAVTTPISEPTPAPTPEPTPEPDPTPELTMKYVMNTNTMKFHYPDCSSVKDIASQNYQEFEGTRDEAIAQGFSPCDRCHP